VRSIEKGIITIEWYYSNGDLIGLKVEQGNLELFAQKKWTHQMHEFTKKFTLPSMSLASISLVLIFSLIISGIYGSYTALLGIKLKRNLNKLNIFILR